MEDAVPSINAQVKKIIEPILKASPQETPKNRISVGKEEILTYYNPHNCRVYYVFSKEGFKIPNRYDSIGCEYSLVNSSEHLFKKFENVNVCVKKNFVEVRPLNNKWYSINKDKPEIVELQKKKIQDDLLNNCTKILKSFVSKFGGMCDFKIHHFRILERKFMGDKITSRIPKGVMFRNDAVKKVYNKENNIEISDGISDINKIAFHDNYTRNLALFDFAPEFVAEIEEVKLYQYRKEALFFLKNNLSCIDDVMKYENYVMLLSAAEKDELCDFIFGKFGCGYHV